MRFIKLIFLIVMPVSVFATSISHVSVNQLSSTQAEKQNLSQEDKAVSLLLPIQSNLSVGELATHHVSDIRYSIPAPLFIVGADSVSLTWLSDNQEKLKQLNAVGAVININTLDDYHKIKQAVLGLDIAPMNIDKLAQEYGINHYPILINGSEVSQ